MFSKLLSDFLFEQFLIQVPAHINDLIIPAMASSRLCLILLQARERSSLWSQSGGRHYSDSERWLPSPCRMHTSCNELPRGPVQRQMTTCISLTRTVSANITYDTVLALPVTAGWLFDCSKCQWQRQERQASNIVRHIVRHYIACDVVCFVVCFGRYWRTRSYNTDIPY